MLCQSILFCHLFFNILRFQAKKSVGSNQLVLLAIQTTIILVSKIYVGNLPASADESSLEAAFSLCGTILNTDVVHYDDFSIQRAYGFVTFADPGSIDKARRFIKASFIESQECYPLVIFPSSEHKYRARIEIYEKVSKPEIISDLRDRYVDKFYEDITYEPKKNNVTVHVDFKSEEARGEFLCYGLRFNSKRPAQKDLPRIAVKITPKQGSYVLRIRNLPPGTTEQDLRAIFMLCGNIETVIIDSVENYLKSGTIVFTSRVASELAESFTGCMINKWPAPVILHRTTQRYDPQADYPACVLVKHFGSGVTLGEIEIKLCPDQIGSVKGVRPRDWERNGFVFMNFKNYFLAERTLRVSGKLYLGGDRPATLEPKAQRAGFGENRMSPRMHAFASMENVSMARETHPQRELRPSQLNVIHQAKNDAFMANLDQKPRAPHVEVEATAPPLPVSFAGPSSGPEPSYALPAVMKQPPAPGSPQPASASCVPLPRTPTPVQCSSHSIRRGPYELIVQYIPDWMGEEDILDHFSITARECELEYGDSDEVKLFFVRKMARDKALRGPHPDGMICRRGSDVGKISD